MGVTFKVSRLANLTAIPNPTPITETELKATTTASVTALPTAAFPGNLGVIKVETNSTLWDVQLTTKWGGKLVKEGVPTSTNPPTFGCPTGSGPDPWNTTQCLDASGNVVAKEEIMNPAVGAPLQYTGGTDVSLAIGIGVADSGKNLSTSATLDYYALGAPSSYGSFLPVQVTQALIGPSNRYDPATGAPNSSVAPIKFSTVLNGSYGGAAVTAQKSWFDGVNTGALTSGGGFGLSPYDGIAYFYVNIGLNRTATTLGFSGNEDGDYTETLYFDLTAQF